MKLKPEEYVRLISAKLESCRHPENAGPMKKYMKDRFEFFGIKAPARRELFKEFIADNGLPELVDLEKTVIMMFELPEREFQYCAIELAARFEKQFTRETIVLLEKIAVLKSWWDSVDHIRMHCLSDYFVRFPEERYDVTQNWIDSDNIWLQRLSVIFQLDYRTETDIRLLERNILQLRNSDEFFVQKAIGWALRQFARTDPVFVTKFVIESDLKPLSRREALKHLSKS